MDKYLSQKQSFDWFYTYLLGDKKFYTFLTADVCWAIWIIHNKITFEGYKMNNVVVISFTTCAFLKCWAGLYVVEDAAWISIGAQKAQRN
jgi:hypothetical protein